MKTETAVLAVIGSLLGIPAAIAISTILNGWVLSILWDWFIVSTFGLPILTIGQSIGVSMVVSFMTYQYIETPKSDSTALEAVGKAIMLLLIRPFLTLFFAWIVHQFVG